MNTYQKVGSAEIHITSGTSQYAFVMSTPARDLMTRPATNRVKKEMASGDIYPWGTSNTWPQLLQKIIGKNTRLKAGLGFTAAQLLGGGIQAISSKMGTDGEPEAWKVFCRKGSFARQYEGLAARDLKTFYLSFVSVVLNEKGDRISYVKTQPTPFCRFSKPNEKGISEFVYVCASWDEVSSENDERVSKIRIIPNYYSPADALRGFSEQYEEREFIYVLRIPTDESIYPVPDYYSVIDHGWVDVSNDVPESKKWLFKNLTHVNYVIYIASWYWRKRYPDWITLERSQKPEDIAILRQRRQDEVKKINDYLTKKENNGKLIVADLFADYDRGILDKDADYRKAFTLEAVPQAKLEGNFLPDQQEADNQISFAIGLDPSTLGAAPGQSRQGGSDKRESFNISQVINYIFEQILLEVPYLIAEYNHMPDDIAFEIRRVTMQTQDKINPEDRQTAFAEKKTTPKNPKKDVN
ncbi:hypothetical protein [Siphonobacter sp. SORGH_AS_0500]|uniref:hypothetical protein n=1 Tax=Siphonobacter sp. SORGH_AS_0500 TaxID=1864824 RepID=UPI00285D7177|nr:hypothetical protein [Siphonobacter sp. SORGH_AS_0500]MDR6196147.1 hypothetical protein [Siphonobacter sp. SORGH_AS_0500]